jgi:DNA-directed RNA polymerase specialized sigma24 family protein
MLRRPLNTTAKRALSVFGYGDLDTSLGNAYIFPSYQGMRGCHLLHQVFHARPEHGSLPVILMTSPARGKPVPIQVVGGPLYPSFHKFYDAVATTKRRMSLAKYFGLDRETPPPGGGVLDLFGVQPKPSLMTVDEVLDAFGPRPRPLGIDLSKRGHEVRKLFYAGFGRRVTRAGLDPEDVLQDIYRGILARNDGICPFDETKSSFGHYVHMVIGCILNNYQRRENRKRDMEQVGIVVQSKEGENGLVDVAEMAERVLVDTNQQTGDPTAALERLSKHLRIKQSRGQTVDPLSYQVAEYLAVGMNRREIAKELGVNHTKVMQVIQGLQQHLSDWI